MALTKGKSSTVKLRLKELVEKGYLVPKGQGRGARYGGNCSRYSPKNKVQRPYSITTMRPIILLTISALLTQGTTLATTYILPTWEQLATISEFIGLVECVTAGGIVARYRVVDSWKGAEVGTELNISQHVDVFEPQFPISLVGERFLVFGEKTASYRISSFTSGGGVPLWWRKIPTDLTCFSPIPLKQPFARYLSAYLGAHTGQIDDFKAAVTDFLKCSREQQELRLMPSAARKNLHLPDPTEPSDKGNEEDIKLYDSLRDSESVEELWERIIDNASRLVVPAIPKTAEERRAQNHKFTLLSMLRDGGRELCQTLLLKTDVSKLPWEKKDVDRTLSEIRRSLSPDHTQPSWLRDADANGQKPPTPDEIAKAETLLSKPWDYQTRISLRTPLPSCSWLSGSLLARMGAFKGEARPAFRLSAWIGFRTPLCG